MKVEIPNIAKKLSNLQLVMPFCRYRSLTSLRCSFDARVAIVPCQHCQKIIFTEGSYKWADGKSISAFDATVVRVETNYGKTRHL